jgi:hypothetical protein
MSAASVLSVGIVAAAQEQYHLKHVQYLSSTTTKIARMASGHDACMHMHSRHRQLLTHVLLVGCRAPNCFKVRAAIS